jgi:hypothetical protein
MINCTQFNNELRGTNNILDISNIAPNEDIVISTSIYIALRGLRILFILLRW